MQKITRISAQYQYDQIELLDGLTFDRLSIAQAIRGEYVGATILIYPQDGELLAILKDVDAEKFAATLSS